MARPVHAPRINNNDDAVKVVSIAVKPGDAVAAGDLLMEVETQKATVTVEAEDSGYVLVLLCEPGQELAVGTIALWIGDHADEVAPGGPTPAAGPDTAEPAAAMTAKARLLLRRHGLAADRIPRSGDRLTAADVEAFLATQPAEAPSPGRRTRAWTSLPAEAETVPLTQSQRGMVNTVSWQRDHAVPAYLEIEYDPRPWDEYAAAFARDHRSLFNPLLALMAHRLVQLAPAHGANGTVLEDDEPRRVRYRHVNLGFTVQADDALYLCVVDAAEALDAPAFVKRLSDLQWRARQHRLAPSELSGATIGFSSMALWGVRRHQPVLAPGTAVMIAHTAPAASGDSAVLGITYDHRLLAGFDAVRLLNALVRIDRGE
jgi:pyruvate/2-oxoglutarate dehydrogenase complex dihydrolipoamide acyltransferase (E2) component